MHRQDLEVWEDWGSDNEPMANARPVTDDELRGMAGDLLRILLPDVDWGALRKAVQTRCDCEIGEDDMVTLDAARRLLAALDHVGTP